MHQSATAAEPPTGQNEPPRPKPAKGSNPSGNSAGQPRNPKAASVRRRRLDISPGADPVKWKIPEFQETRNSEKPKTIKALNPRSQRSRPEIRSRGIGDGVSRRQARSAAILELFRRLAANPDMSPFSPLSTAGIRPSRSKLRIRTGETTWLAFLPKQSRLAPLLRRNPTGQGAGRIMSNQRAGASASLPESQHQCPLPASSSHSA